MASDITGRQDMGGQDVDDGEDPRFLIRHRTSIIVGVVAVLVLAVIAWLTTGTVNQAPVHRVETVTIVPVQPVKPPPPPPPPPQQMIQQPKITTPEIKEANPNQPPKAAPPKPAAPASVPMGTSLKANGQANNFDLTGTPGGNGLLGGGGGGGGSRWGWYQNVMQAQLNQALHENKTTTQATFQVTARVWVDAAGLVTRVVVAPSGNPAVDDAIRNQVLVHMRFNQPPPADMPMPIVLSLTGESPL